jgi:hypothetical protein
MLLVRFHENDVSRGDRAILFRLGFRKYLHPRGAADDTIDLVLIVGALLVIFSRLQNVDAATQCRDVQKLAVWNTTLDAFSSLIDLLERLNAHQLAMARSSRANTRVV